MEISPGGTVEFSRPLRDSDTMLVPLSAPALKCWAIFSPSLRDIRGDVSLGEVDVVLGKKLFHLLAEHSTRLAVDNHLLCLWISQELLLQDGLSLQAISAVNQCPQLAACCSLIDAEHLHLGSPGRSLRFSRQLTICSRRTGLNPTMTCSQATMVGTERWPPLARIISSSAARFWLTSISRYAIPFFERNSFALLQWGHVGVE